MEKNPLKIKLLEDNYKNYMKISNESSFKSVYKFDFKNNGNGKMTAYEVFQGIYLTFIEVYGFKIDQFVRLNGTNNITINHCKKGRFECKFNEKYLFLEEGDLVASTKTTENKYSSFPLGFYEGIEIFIDINIAKDSLKNMLGYSFDLDELYNKISNNENITIFKATNKIEHIFSELYNVDEKIQEMYFKLKILELFLFLKISSLTNEIETIPRLSKKQVEIVKNIKKEIVKNISAPITLKELSKKYKISVSSLKSSFKIVYGKPLFTWRKEYRLQQAKKLLKESDKNISSISHQVGYKNSSKFSAAFKSYYNITPSEYRFQNR